MGYTYSQCNFIEASGAIPCELGLAAPQSGLSLSPDKLIYHSVALMHRVHVGT